MEVGSHIYVLFYMDDMLITSQIFLAIQRLKSLHNSAFEMKDMGVAKKILGMEIKRG